MLSADFGQYEDALSNINRAIEIDTLNGRYFYTRALINLRFNNLDYICNDYARAVKLKYTIESEDLKKRCANFH
jgi:tetratricopeptide (TPR) repeat protein